MRPRFISRVLLLPIALVLVAAGTVGAFAANYNVYGESIYGGAGRVKGSLNYKSLKKFRYNASVRDICPPDGVGVSFYFELQLGNGAQYLTNYKGQDTNGCGWESWVPASGKVERPRVIKKSRLIGCWTDDGNPCWMILGLSTWKKNPYDN